MQPECLKWARERAGLSEAILAKKMQVKEEKVLAWEKTGEITLAHTEHLAAATHVPLGYLFLPIPPVEPLPIEDFRTVSSVRMVSPSPALLDTIAEAQRRQDWYRDYLQAAGAVARPFVGSIGANADVFTSAQKIRQTIEWGTPLRSKAKTWEEALRLQVDAVEDAGILVMQNSVVGTNNHRPLEVSEFRGFALSDLLAPLIFLNSRDSKAARMFTLAHEVVHIFVGATGVSNLVQTQVSAQASGVEKFCNAVAAELLIPQDEITSAWASARSQTDAYRVVGRHFKVSSLVVIRRLRDIGVLTETEFSQAYADELSSVTPVRSALRGGDFFNTLRSRLGKRFSTALVESTLEGDTGFREATRLVGIRDVATFNKFAGVVAR